MRRAMIFKDNVYNDMATQEEVLAITDIRILHGVSYLYKIADDTEGKNKLYTFKDYRIEHGYKNNYRIHLNGRVNMVKLTEGCYIQTYNGRTYTYYEYMGVLFCWSSLRTSIDTVKAFAKMYSTKYTLLFKNDVSGFLDLKELINKIYNYNSSLDSDLELGIIDRVEHKELKLKNYTLTRLLSNATLLCVIEDEPKVSADADLPF